MDNQQLIESLNYHLNEVEALNLYNSNIKDITDDEEVKAHPVYKKIEKLSRAAGGRLTQEQATSIVALSILLKYKDKSHFTKESAKSVFKHVFPKASIISGLFTLFWGVITGLMEYPRLTILIAISIGLLSGGLYGKAYSYEAERISGRMYDWAEQWAFEHGWYDSEGKLKGKKYE